jgi:hypothetical protein
VSGTPPPSPAARASAPQRGESVWDVRVNRKDPDAFSVLWADHQDGGVACAAFHYCGRLPHGMIR